ncbi:MAG: CDC27 family protein [Clostridiaceae bacterium]|nr:CDC27 family protein [Clostridiaceae bacterium]
MNPWVILNIPENSSLKEIKKTYASLLKEHNPEDDPEGYQRLREAYNKACKIAKKNKSVHSNLIDNNTQLANTHNKINKENLHNSSLLSDSNLYGSHKFNFSHIKDIENTKIDEHNDSSTVITYINKEINDDEENYYNLSTYKRSLNNLYLNINQRYNIESWNQLLNKIPFWDLVTLKSIEEYTIIFLLKNSHISLETWSLIDNYFSLSENSSRYNASNQLIDLIKIMGYSTQLSYDFIKNITLKDVDLYLKHRLNAFILISNNRMYDAIEELNEANKLCNFDECLFDLYGYTYLSLNKYNLALDMFSKAVKINKSDIKAMINLSKLYCSSKQYNTAINYLEPLYNDFNIKTDEILIMTALCYYHLDRFKEARILFEKLSNIKYAFFKKYINNIDLNLKLKVINHKLKYNFNFFNLADDLKNKNAEYLLQRKKHKRSIFERFNYHSIPRPLIICISLIILSFGFHLFNDNTNTTNNSTYNKNFHDTPNTHIDLHENYTITDIQSVPYYIITKDDKDYLATFDEYNSIKDTAKIKYRVYFGYSNGKGIFFFYNNEVKDNKANVEGICTLYGKKINDELKNYAIDNLKLNPNIDCTCILITSYSPTD